MANTSLRLIATAAAGLMSSWAIAETSRVGHWAQSDFNNPCSAIFGFQLNADGSANVDWVETKWNAGKRAAEFVKTRREGRWTSKGGALNLTVVEVITDPKQLALFDKTGPVTTKTELSGSIAADGKRLSATVKAQNVAHEVFTFACVYDRR